MSNPIQPAFKMRVFNGKRVSADTLKGANLSTNGDYIDIEQCLSPTVVYAEQASLLNTLTFTVNKYADILLYYFYIGQSVIFYGGNYTENNDGLVHVFSGTVTRIRTNFKDNGKVTFSVECMNYGFTKMGKDRKSNVYPDPRSKRKNFAVKSVKLEDIIKGIAEENNMKIGVLELTNEAKVKTFDLNNIRYQRDQSDWDFLNSLASDFGCSMWISSEDGVEKINFCSINKLKEMPTEVGFMFPLYGKVTDVKDSEIILGDTPADNRPRMLREVTVEEDISQAYAVSRSAMYFDKDAGEFKEAISKIETDKNGRRTITFYELDEERVAWVDEHLPDVAKQIRENSPTSLPWGDPSDPHSASYYYIAKKIYDENVAVFDKAFFGITVSARCNMDLKIRSQRTYPIRGILSYHSKDLKTNFFLRGLKHVWEDGGTYTELDFIR